jgi:hypothetical protein
VLTLPQRRLVEQINHAHDAIHRGPYLVAHHGQHAPLGLRLELRLVRHLANLAGAPLFGDVMDRAHEQFGPAPISLAFYELPAQPHPGPGAIRCPQPELDLRGHCAPREKVLP